MSITVKVIRVPGAVSEVGLNDGATVQDALDAASVTVGESEVMKLEGVTTPANTVVTDGARIIVAKGAKGA